MTDFENALKQILSPLTWEKSNDVFYFTKFCSFADNQVLNGSIGSIETNEVPALLIPHIQNIMQNLENFYSQSKQLIANNHPENDCKNLPFNEIMLKTNGDFSLGFDTGDSPAGNLVIFVEYDKNFEQNPELIYEVY